MLRDQLIQILEGGGFELSKWASNKTELLPSNQTPERLSDSVHFTIHPDTESKVLGLIWNSQSDHLKYSFNPEYYKSNANITKRVILSITAQIFDPLGLLGPIIILAKIILQRLWSLKLDWDEAVPSDIYTTWIKLVQGLQCLNHFEIPRKVIAFYPYKTIQLHGFSDSSERAYGACVYIRVIDDQNVISTSLICAKSRVAPLAEKQSIPRLELCGALL